MHTGQQNCDCSYVTTNRLVLSCRYSSCQRTSNERCPKQRVQIDASRYSREATSIRNVCRTIQCIRSCQRSLAKYLGQQFICCTVYRWLGTQNLCEVFALLMCSVLQLTNFCSGDPIAKLALAFMQSVDMILPGVYMVEVCPRQRRTEPKLMYTFNRLFPSSSIFLAGFMLCHRTLRAWARVYCAAFTSFQRRELKRPKITSQRGY